VNAHPNLDQAFAPLTPEELAFSQEIPASKPADDVVQILPVPADAPEPTFRHPRYSQPTAWWCYRDPQGAILGYAARFDPPNERKQIIPYTLWRGERGLFWRWRQFQGLRPLYGLDLLAANPGKAVVVVEGEKCADAGGIVFPSSVVITSPAGAKAAKEADWSPIQGRRVLIWPDADAEGTGYANDVAALAHEAGAADIRIVDAFALASRSPNGEAREVPEKWDVADALDEGWNPADLRKAAVDASTLYDVASAPEYVTFGSFKMTAKGLRHDDGETPTWISDPFEILAATRDDAGSSWGLMLRWRDPDGRQHTWAMPRQLVYGDGAALCGELAGRGLSVAPSAKCRNLLLNYLAFAQPKARVTCVNRTGWHEQGRHAVYVLPDRAIGGTDDCKIVLQTGSAVRSPFASRGSLEDWQERVAALCAHNSRLAFAVSSALAGCLLWLTGAESGGFHLVGSSSRGKTTALQVAASVWGRGDKSGFLKTWRGTANGMEGIAATHSDAALVLDEIG
jgi:putative DNA primase/helicase